MSTNHSPHALFFFFCSGDSSRTPIPLLRPDQSTVAQLAETTLDCERFPDALHVSSLDSIVSSDFVGSRVYMRV